MAKWADYLISQVSYDQDHIITKVMQHRDIGNKISGGEIVDRNAVSYTHLTLPTILRV